MAKLSGSAVIQLRPKFKFPAKIEMVFSQILASFYGKKQWYKPKKVKKLALNPQLLTVQILTNDVQVLIFASFLSVST